MKFFNIFTNISSSTVAAGLCVLPVKVKTLTYIIIFVFLLSCAGQYEIVKYNTFTKERFPVRETDAETGTEDENYYLKNGYKKIGILSIKQVDNICYKKCKSIPHSLDATGQLLKSAAENGGDVVLVMLNKVKGTENISKKGECVKSHEEPELIFAYDPMNTESGHGAFRIIHKTVCDEYEVLKGKQEFTLSSGSVWRKETINGDSSVNNTEGMNSKFKIRKVGPFELVYIRSGEFLMGSDISSQKVSNSAAPVHMVKITGFWIGRFEISQKEYSRIMGINPSLLKDYSLPVENVNWFDAAEFCKKIGKKYGVKARLPYEAEWEFACRAGSNSRYPWGDKIDGSYCWYAENATSTFPSGITKANAWGLFDMIGNVNEWCYDFFDPDYYKYSPAENPTGPATGTSRVYRGGSWDVKKENISSTNRSGDNPSNSSANIGFRIVIEDLK